ncbi:SixA phosphatase family protein [Membranihabitans marinus]|uniref:SixA phosphatase family protein n=1 Tax=Membranihabitans marinus TaxID=1227546 RepID=UPI001F2DF48C|nr:histidine phosphatase family protein [Membranihabitans marinus]
MKNFCLIRHAKSDRDHLSYGDFDRPLHKRGRSDAYMMADILHKDRVVFDMHLYSTALRAKQTENIFEEILGHSGLIRKSSDDLYLPSAATIWRHVQGLDESISHPALFAHNFGIEDFVHSMDSSIRVPTCFVGFFESEVTRWQDISVQNTEIIHYLYPKMFR